MAFTKQKPKDITATRNLEAAQSVVALWYEVFLLPDSHEHCLGLSDRPVH